MKSTDTETAIWISALVILIIWLGSSAILNPSEVYIICGPDDCSEVQ